MCKGLSIDDVGVSRDTVFQEIRPGAGLKLAISLKTSWGGYRSKTQELIRTCTFLVNPTTATPAVG